MKKRIKEKIFMNRHNPKLHYSINQILEATKFTIIWWRAANGYNYAKSYYCGRITKVKRRNEQKNIKHKDK